MSLQSYVVLRSSILLVTLVVIGCHSSTPKNSPENVSPPIRDRWIGSYRAARAGDANACATFRALAKEPEFPAAKLAELRALESCPEPAPAIDREALPNYLRDLGLDVSLKLARARGDKALEVDLNAELAKRKMPQIEKIALLKLAIKRAGELDWPPAKTARLTAQLYQTAPRLNPNPAPREFLSVATDYRLAREFGPARAYFEKIFAGDFSVEDKIAALKGLRLSHKNARDQEQHLRAAHRLTAYVTRVRALRSKSPKLRAAAYDARAYEARAIWTAGRPADAGKLFAGMELEMRGRQPLSDLYWLRARLAEESRDYKEVTRYLDLALNEKPGDAVRDKLLWYAAWNERARGNPDAAIEKMRTLDAATKDESARTRALYWLGHTLKERGAAREAEQTFERVIGLDPVGYYGLLAHRQLGRAIKLNVRPLPTRRAVVPTLDAGLADWLAAIGESEPLAALLDEAVQGYLKRGDQDDDGWVDLLQNYARAGLYLKLFEGISLLSPERRRSVLDAHPDLLFPRPWADVAGPAAARFGIDDGLIYAIMRQESAFDPHARSGADAFGLMQLLPEVAQRTAKHHQLSYAWPEDLFEPATVIPLGAAFLRELSDRYRGQLILLSAAYNASDAAIRGWVKQRYRGDALSFIEEIPYEETRVYVRLVMRNLIFYRLLKSQPAALPFPEEVLRLDAAEANPPSRGV